MFIDRQDGNEQGNKGVSFRIVQQADAEGKGQGRHDGPNRNDPYRHHDRREEKDFNGNCPGCQDQENSQGGSDALSAFKPEEKRAEMADKSGKSSQAVNVGSVRGQQNSRQGRERSFQGIAHQGDEPGFFPAYPADIGGAYIAAALQSGIPGSQEFADHNAAGD